ncbi:MAG: GNAT family N-acetyltransferase, partial [Candidatus Methylomirabilis sp.]|nr:GNAT family N-acetyltransferase [Deltaproteobacteria bacterium]
STVELGIGRIPHTTLALLKDKRDLGVHTEMFTDGLIDLIESGAVTGARKTLDRGKVVASFCLGTQRLYDYIDGNPLFAFCPTEYVNDPALIARQERMVAINVALEVDLTGQVCADSLGTRFFSGIGGQVDFNRGAARSRGGKAIIALPSTAKGGKVSRIVARLSSGAGVVTTRGDVHYVVTEHGVAYVHGKSVQERALALIGVAHPDFRTELLHGAIEAKYLRPDMADVAERIGAGPRELRASLLLDDGTLLSFRPVHPTDEPRMRDLYYALSRESLYFRFMGYMKRIPRRQLHDFVYVDHRHAVAVVGTLPAAQGEEIVAVGSYYVEPKTNRAEVAFTVRDDFHRRGIGTFLLGHLMTIARRGGLAGFTAEVLADDVGMRAVFAGADCKVRSSVRAGVVRYDLDFA